MNERIEAMRARYLAAMLPTRRKKTVNGYHGSIASLFHFLEEHHSDLSSLAELSREPHITGWLGFLASRKPPYAIDSRRRYIFQVRNFLDRIHEKVDAARLNDLRLTVIGGLNAAAWLRPAYYGLARSALAAICGNELAMQRRLNLSIQLPGDESSLLPVHADVWAGDSPFEVVLWVPLVDCHDTKSMFLLPPEPDHAARARWDELGGKSTEDLFQAIEADLEWLSVPYGKVVVVMALLQSAGVKGVGLVTEPPPEL